MLKISVITMGALIFLTLIVIVVTIYNRWLGNTSEKIHSQKLKIDSIYEKTIALPEGAHIQNMIVKDNQIVLQLLWPDGKKGILLFDSATGRKIGTISFK